MDSGNAKKKKADKTADALLNEPAMFSTDYHDDVLESIHAAVKRAIPFPSAEDGSFYRTVSAEYREKMDLLSKTLLETANGLLAAAAVDRVRPLNDLADVTDDFDVVVDVLDNIFEKLVRSLIPRRRACILIVLVGRLLGGAHQINETAAFECHPGLASCLFDGNKGTFPLFRRCFTRIN